MKKYFLILFIFLSAICKGQVTFHPNYLPQNTGLNILRGIFENGLHLPSGSSPHLFTGQWNGSGAVFIDTISHFLYYYSGGLWIPVIDSLHGGSGEINTASNISGTGIGIFKDKSSYDLRFKRLVNDFGFIISDHTDSVGFKIDTAATEIHSLGFLENEFYPLASNPAGYLVGGNNLSDLTNISTARTNLGFTGWASNLVTTANPSAVRFIRINADNTVTLRSATELAGDINALLKSDSTGSAGYATRRYIDSLAAALGGGSTVTGNTIRNAQTGIQVMKVDTTAGDTSAVLRSKEASIEITPYYASDSTRADSLNTGSIQNSKLVNPGYYFNGVYTELGGSVSTGSGTFNPSGIVKGVVGVTTNAPSNGATYIVNSHFANHYIEYFFFDHEVLDSSTGDYYRHSFSSDTLFLGNGITFLDSVGFKIKVADTSSLRFYALEGSGGGTSFNDSLQAYYKFDESSGHPQDATSNAHHATSESVTYSATGKINTALQFGASNYVNIGAVSAFDATTFSISIWFYPTALGSADEYLIDKYTPGATASGYQLRIGTDSRLHLLLGNGTTQNFLTVSDALSINTWYHAVVTWNGTSWTSSINGSFYASGSQTATVVSTGASLKIGNDAGSSAPFFGKIDEVGIWRGRVLSSAEAAQLYNSGSGLPYSSF